MWPRKNIKISKDTFIRHRRETVQNIIKGIGNYEIQIQVVQIRT